jgi:hypothetical protein
MNKQDFLKNNDQEPVPARFVVQFDPMEALEQYKVDPTKLIEKPRVILTCHLDSPLATVGNCSLIIGKAKSKKTFLLTSIAAAAISGECSISCIKGKLSDVEVILVDTEQAAYHLHLTVKRIIRQTGGTMPTNFTAYGLRPLTPNQRLQVIECIVNEIKTPTLVIIDGLRDLLNKGINDELEATSIMSKILNWTYEKECHVMLVLHQNKNDMNARGHVGTEAVNKSETVLSVTVDSKDRDVSIVTAEYCRDIDFPSFCFSIGEDGLPHEVDATDAGQSSVVSDMIENFTFILTGKRPMTYTVLVEQYQEVSGKGMATAKKHISAALKQKILRKEGSGAYHLYKDFGGGE